MLEFTKRHLRWASGLASGARAGFHMAHSSGHRGIWSGCLRGSSLEMVSGANKWGPAERSSVCQLGVQEAPGQCPSYCMGGPGASLLAPMVAVAPKQQGSVGRGKGRRPQALCTTAWRRCAMGLSPQS